MGHDIYSILELCGLGCVAFWLVGSATLLLGVHKARGEFRAKGFLRPPSGTRWFRFLLWKHYDAFDDAGTRFVFGIAHFCMLGVIIVVMAVVVLLGSEIMFNGLSGLPGMGTPMPDTTISQ